MPNLFEQLGENKNDKGEARQLFLLKLLPNGITTERSNPFLPPNSLTFLKFCHNFDRYFSLVAKSTISRRTFSKQSFRFPLMALLANGFKKLPDGKHRKTVGK